MRPDEQAVESDLRDHLAVLRRRKVVVLLAMTLVTGTALITSHLQTPVYVASARVLLQGRATESLFDPNTGQRNDPARAVETQIEVIKSKPVRDAVRTEIGTAPPISASGVGGTDVIKISAESTSPRRAAEIANAYATAYVDFRRNQAVNDVLAAGEEVRARVNDVQSQIDALEEQASTAPADKKADVRATVEQQKNALVDQQGFFKQRLQQLQVDAALKTGGAQLVTPASAPESPASPKPLRSGILGLAFGSMLGVAAAFVLDFLDDSVKSKEDLDRAIPGVPNLGLIPTVSGWKSADEPRVVSVDDPGSSAAEAYRGLRTAVRFTSLGNPIRMLQITSPGAQEGKSTTAANLAVALARAGQRVCVVCCDLRRPRIHGFFEIDHQVGFTSVLLGELPLTAALHPVPGEPRLFVLPSGPLPPNPSELLSSPRAAEVFQSLRSQADIVVVDSPPVLPVTDALIVAGQVDATLLVCGAGATTRRQVARSVELLHQLGAPLRGTVLNSVAGHDIHGYGSRYYQYRPHAEPVTTVSENGQASGDDGGADGKTVDRDPAPEREAPRRSTRRGGGLRSSARRDV